MAPRMNGSEKAHGGMGMQKARTPSYLITTLYDVIAAIQDGLSPDDDALVVATVMYLLRSGRLAWRGQASGRPGLSQCVALGAMPRVTSLTTMETSWSPDPREECTL